MNNSSGEVSTITSYNNNSYMLNSENSNEEGITDISVVAANYYSAVRTKSILEAPYVYDKKPQLDCVPSSLKMDFSRILNKPYFVKNITWAAAANAFAFLDTIEMPSQILNNDLASIPFKSSALYRAKMCLILQVAGTPMHSGIVLVSANPIKFNTGTAAEASVLNVNSLMCSPHVFLAANEASAAALELPFYVNGKLQKTDLDHTTVTPYNFGVDYVEANFMVLNSLGVPTSGSNTVTISVHVMFTDVEFYVPHADVEFVAQSFEAQTLVDDLSKSATKAIDGVFSVAKRFSGDLLDNLRGGVRALTGLHNPNISNLAQKDYVVNRNSPNVVDKSIFEEKMDPFCDFDRITRDFTYDTGIDEMSMRHLYSKPQYLSTFVVSNTDAAGTLCWARPITPAQDFRNFSYVSTSGATIPTSGFANIPQFLYNLSRFWRGTIKIHIQSSMSNFHYCKLAVVRDYSPRQNSLTATPNFAQVPNLMTETLEFSSGNQVQTIELPFCSPLEQLPCTRDWTLNSLEHGMYYIYLMQPLVTNGTVVNTVRFNVYISLGDDFDFFGYAVDPLRRIILGTISDTPGADENTFFEAQSAANPVVSLQEGILNTGEQGDEKIHDLRDFRPIVSIRDYGRRFYRRYSYKVSGASLDADDGIRVFDVADLLGIRKGTVTSNATSASFAVSTLQLLQSLYLGYSGGGRVKLVLTGVPLVSAWYIPPSYIDYPKVPPVVDSPNNVWVGTMPYDSLSTATAGFKERLRQQFEFVKNVNPENLSPSFSTQSVLCERPNYKMAQGSLMIRQTGDVSSLQDTSFSNCEMEFEIPNMSPYRFVGDTSKIHTSGKDSIENSVTTNLGYIVVELLHPQFRLGDSSLLDASLQIDIYSSFDDTARLGFQCFCPIVAYHGALNGGTQAFQLAGNMNPLDTIPGSGIAPSCRPNYPICYTTKTA